MDELRADPEYAATREALGQLLAAGTAPVLVYQMGKVGSTAVVAALERAGLPVLQIHSLGEGLLGYYRKLRREGWPVPPHVHLGLALRERLREGWPGPLRVISLVRDPVAREVSNRFENIRMIEAPLFDARGRLYGEAMLRHVEAWLCREGALDYVFGWFDRELKPVLGVDVMALPFPAEQGWIVHRASGVEVLLMQQEALGEAGPQALRAFLGAEGPVAIPEGRRREGMRFGEVYRWVRERLRLPRQVLERIYGSRFCTHFYTEGQRRAFLERWAARQR